MIVLVLNSYLLFQNVYTTYKALKPPKPSRKAKNGVDPIVKAKHARKRELKGMLACWIVWSCWSSAERVADRTISVLTPFYSEIKMFLILFLILGRSTMAEPILLHVIRPLVKPYYVSLDACVDIFTSAADLAVLLFSSPLVWIRLVTRHAWTFLQKTFSSGSASLPRPGNHAVSASDADESLNEPNTPSESTDATKAKAEPDPLQRFVPKTRGALAQPESDDEDVIYKNPLRDDPPPYGVPIDLPLSRERDFPPVFSTPARRGTSRTRRMSVDHRTPYLPDTSMATTASYRPDSDMSTSFALSPNTSHEITHGAGDLAPDRDVPAFSLATPEQPPVVPPAAPAAIPSYLQPRTRASRANLRPARPAPVDNYTDQPNPRASEFLQGERGMTFADKPKEAKGLTPDVSASYVSPPPSAFGISSPPAMPIPMIPPQPAGYGNPYGRGRPGAPTRPYVPVAPVDDGYESPRGGGGYSSSNSNDFIQGWRQRSAIPVDAKSKRQQNGPSGYSYQAAPPSYVASPTITSPSIAPSFPVPSVAPSLTPSQSVSNVFPRPQPGYRPPPPADNRPPTAVSGRPPSATPSHPPTSTTGMGLGLPRRQRSTRELRAQAWEPKEDNSAAEAERLAEEERRAIEQKEAERQAALDRQRRKVSDSQQYQRTPCDQVEEQARRDGHGGKLRGRAARVRTRDRVSERALRGVGVEKRVRGVVAEKDKTVAEKDLEVAAVHDNGGESAEESPRKRRRVGEDGESVEVVGPESSPGPKPVPTQLDATAKLPTKRTIDEVAPETKPRVSSRMAPKPPTHRTRPLASKIDRPQTIRGPTRPSTTARPPVSRLPRASGRDSKPVVSKSPASGSRNVTNN